MTLRIAGRDCLEVIVERLPLEDFEGGTITVSLFEPGIIQLSQPADAAQACDEAIAIPLRLVPYLQKALSDALVMANSLTEPADAG